MKVGIMQPYLFPYLGYFQSINAVDKFVLYDDVQYIKRGWINRNNLLCNKKPHMFVFSIIKDHQYKNINERFYINGFNIEKEKFLNTLKTFYKKAPYFIGIYSLIEKILVYPDNNVSEFNENSLKIMCEYLDIKTQFIKSTDLSKNKELKGEYKIIQINKILNSNCYINSIGGIELYLKENFQKENIKLNFIKMKDVNYRQFDGEFVSNLSIVDVLMFNSKEEVKKLLNEYELV